MKIAYIAQIGLDKNNGVVNKIRNQVEAWQDMGHETRLLLLTSDTNTAIEDTSLSELNNKSLVYRFNLKSVGTFPIDVIKDWVNLKSKFEEVRGFLKKFKPDIVYGRYGFYQPFYRKIGKEYKLIAEVNTDFDSEYSILRNENIKRRLKYWYYRKTKKLFLDSVSAIAAVTKELGSKYDMKVGFFPNSLNVEEYNVLGATKAKKETPNLIFMGTPGMAWHGIDILLELSKLMPEVRVDIIGYSKDDLANTPSNVFLHGFLLKERYIELLVNSTAAIGTLALFRKNMVEACPLKVREYMACCIPLVLPYKDTTFEVNGYPDWVLRVDFQREPLETVAHKISSFLVKYAQYSIKQKEIFNYIDVSVIEKKRLAFFEEVRKK